MPRTSVEESGDYTSYASKEPTDLQVRFADWLIEKVGVNFGTKKEQAAFEEGVRLATALRMPFQRSAENQAVSPLVRGNAAAPAAKPAKAVKAAPAAKPAKAAPAKRGRAAAPVTETVDPEPPAEEAEEAPRTRRPARRTRAAASEVQAPF